jgi:diguanylate cyclase (GGDEF)-like protein
MLEAAVTGLLTGVVVAAVPAGLMLRRGLARLRERDQLLAVLRYETEHDALTGLASRMAFYARAAGALAGNRAGLRLAVALMDVDDFRHVNDSIGHGTGDLVLHVLAGRLQAAGAAGLVARLGGDEFAAIVPLDDDESAYDVGAALHAVGAEPIDLDQLVVHVGVSVGVVPVDGPADLAVVLGRADNAMYRAKHGRLGAVVYDPALDDDAAPMPGCRPAVRSRDLTVDGPLVGLPLAVTP